MKKHITAMQLFLIATVLAVFSNLSLAGEIVRTLKAETVITRDLNVSGNSELTGSVRYVPNVAAYSALAKTTTINPLGKSFIVIKSTGVITMSSLPTISVTAAKDGQELRIMGGSANAITFTDNGTLAGSLLELGAATRVLTTGLFIDLVYHDGKWYERFNPPYTVDQNLNTTNSPTFANVTTTDDIDVGDDLRVVGLTTVGETLTVTGNSYYGAVMFKSTMTASDGNWAVTGAVTSLGTITGGALTTAGTVTGAAVNVSGSGQVLLGNATSAGLALLTPGQAKGAMIVNSTTNELCISTATVVGSWVLARSIATACY